MLPAVLLAGLLVVACTRPPTSRPREGAPPSSLGRLATEPPPTLAPAAGLVPTAAASDSTATPAPVATPSVSASPGVYPIISNMQPPPGAALPPGDIVIGARVTGSSTLVDVLAFVDGEPFQPSIGNPASRSMVFSFVRQLENGVHEVRIQARDDRGQSGGYRWEFTVGPRQPLPTVTPPSITDPLPTFTVPSLAPQRGTPAPTLEAGR